MKYFGLLLFSTVTFALLITACESSNKKTNQVNVDRNKDSLSNQSIEQFLFLSEWFGKTGVYKYNLFKKKYSPVWWHPRENVVMLIYRPEKLPAYFVTAAKTGVRANLPFFERIKVYKIAPDFSETIQIDKIKDGLQFTARWNDDGNLEFIYTSIDKVVSSYVNQYTKVYDFYGKLIDSRIETFDIEKSGFPYLKPERSSTVSPLGKYGVTFLSDSVLLKTAGVDSAKFITVMQHNLNKVKWSEDEQFLFISTQNLNNETVKAKNPETSELFVYSLTADSLVEAFGGDGLKNFFTSGDLLIFDDGFGKNSHINIYSLEKLEVVDSVKPNAGCGLVFIPKQ
jgi:hypothetical protein